MKILYYSNRTIIKLYKVMQNLIFYTQRKYLNESHCQTEKRYSITNIYLLIILIITIDKNYFVQKNLILIEQKIKQILIF